jgi:uncharacterized protein
MSRNVEVVQSLYADLDLAKIRAGAVDVAGLVAPAFELHPPEQSPDRQTYRGLEGLLAYLEMQLDLWDHASFATEQFIDAADRVVVFGRFSVRGKASGVPITIPSAHVWTLRDGRVVSMAIYSDRTEAMKAVGLALAGVQKKAST